MNISAVLSQIGDHGNALLHAKQAIIEGQKELEQCKNCSMTYNLSCNEISDLAKVLAISYNNLATEEEHFNNYENALRAYEQAVKVLQEYIGDQNELTQKFVTRYENFAERLNQIKYLALHQSEKSSHNQTNKPSETSFSANTYNHHQTQSQSPQVIKILTQPKPQSAMQTKLARANSVFKDYHVKRKVTGSLLDKKFSCQALSNDKTTDLLKRTIQQKRLLAQQNQSIGTSKQMASTFFNKSLSNSKPSFSKTYSTLGLNNPLPQLSQKLSNESNNINISHTNKIYNQFPAVDLASMKLLEQQALANLNGSMSQNNIQYDSEQDYESIANQQQDQTQFSSKQIMKGFLKQKPQLTNQQMYIQNLNAPQNNQRKSKSSIISGQNLELFTYQQNYTLKYVFDTKKIKSPTDCKGNFTVLIHQPQQIIFQFDLNSSQMLSFQHIFLVDPNQLQKDTIENDFIQLFVETMQSKLCVFQANSLSLIEYLINPQKCISLKYTVPEHSLAFQLFPIDHQSTKLNFIFQQPSPSEDIILAQQNQKSHQKQQQLEQNFVVGPMTNFEQFSDYNFSASKQNYQQFQPQPVIVIQPEIKKNYELNDIQQFVTIFQKLNNKMLDLAFQKIRNRSQKIYAAELFFIQLQQHQLFQLKTYFTVLTEIKDQFPHTKQSRQIIYNSQVFQLELIARKTLVIQSQIPNACIIPLSMQLPQLQTTQELEKYLKKLKIELYLFKDYPLLLKVRVYNQEQVNALRRIQAFIMRKLYEKVIYMQHTPTGQFFKVYMKQINQFTSIILLNLSLNRRQYMQIPANILTSFNISNSLPSIYYEILKFITLENSTNLASWRDIDDIKEWRYVVIEIQVKVVQEDRIKIMLEVVWDQKNYCFLIRCKQNGKIVQKKVIKISKSSLNLYTEAKDILAKTFIVITDTKLLLYTFDQLVTDQANYQLLKLFPFSISQQQGLLSILLSNDYLYFSILCQKRARAMTMWTRRLPVNEENWNEIVSKAMQIGVQDLVGINNKVFVIKNEFLASLNQNLLETPAYNIQLSPEKAPPQTEFNQLQIKYLNKYSTSNFTQQTEDYD